MVDRLPSPLYIAFQGLETYFVDKDTGAPLSGGLVKFFSDVARSVPKDVFQQTQLVDNTYEFVNIGSEVGLTAVGTFESPDDGTDIQVYAYPYNEDGDFELYYLEIWSAGTPEDPAGILQFTREAQPANAVNDSGIQTFVDSDNQIENPQFVVTLLDATLTHEFTVTGTGTETSIAPDWSLITNGSGTVTVTQLALTDISMPTGAPFAIRINSTGITSLKLRQQITQSPRILGQGFIFGSVVAKSFDASEILLVMDYVASNGYTVNLVNESTTDDGEWTTLANDVAADISTTNNNSPLTPGYVNIDITIPTLSDVGITSVQVVNTGEANSTSEFIQESVPRQIDHLFHYYKPQLEYKPIPSALVGWDFPLNPAQFATSGSSGTTGAIGANKSAYAWDQTILFSTVNSGLAYARNGGDTDLSFQVTPASNTSWAMIQYIPVQTARTLLSQSQCAFLRAYVASGTVNGTVSLWYTKDTNLPTVTAGTNNSLVSAITAGFPTCANGTWVEIERPLGQADFVLNGGLQDFKFSGWGMIDDADSSTATFMAIVVAFDTTLTTQNVVIDSCALQQGDIPTRPAPQAPDEVLRECQYYYEKSYDVTVDASTSTVVGALVRGQACSPNGGNFSVYATPFSLEYSTVKRATSPVVTFYTTAGVAGSVRMTITNTTGDVAADVAITQWQSRATGMKAATYLGPTATAQANASGGSDTGMRGWIQFQYTVDARLGIVN